MTLRLNLGCGDDRQEGDGWVNVDLRPDISDVQAPADRLPWDDGTADEVQALDLLEHFWRDDVGAVLAEWHRVLRPGGTLTLRVPNLLALSQQLAEAELTTRVQARARGAERANKVADSVVHDTIRNIYGGHRWGPGGSWDAHHWGFTPTSLERTLERAGFAVLSNDRRANMTVRAQR